MPDDETAFPIFDSTKTKRGKDRTPYISGGVDPRALALIDAAQPYHGSSPEEIAADPLLLLKQLSNIDKHRLLVVLAESYVGTEMRMGSGGGSATGVRPVGDVHRTVGQPLKPNTSLGGIAIQPAEFQRNPYVEGHATLAIVFGDSEVPGALGEPVANLLQEVLQAARGVIDSLRIYTLPAAFRG